MHKLCVFMVIQQMLRSVYLEGRGTKKKGLPYTV